jgi:hypothetical protein
MNRNGNVRKDRKDSRGKKSMETIVVNLLAELDR